MEESLTSYAGVPRLLRAARSLDVPGSVNCHLHLQQRPRGFDEASYVESFLVRNALGGDCLEDFDRLGEEPGLKEMLGYEIPSPEAARKFLYQLHEAEKLEQAQRELPAGQVSSIPEESAALRALAQVNQDLVGKIAGRCADQKIATMDVDATVMECWNSDLSRRQGISAGVGLVGGNGVGRFRPVSGWECAGPQRVVGSEAARRGAGGKDYLCHERAHDTAAEGPHRADRGAAVKSLSKRRRDRDRVHGCAALVARGRRGAAGGGRAITRCSDWGAQATEDVVCGW